MYSLVAFDQCPLLIIYLVDNSKVLALETKTATVDCAVKVYLWIPDRPNTFLIHVDTVDSEIALHSLINLTRLMIAFHDNSLLCPSVNQVDDIHTIFSFQ